RRQPPIAPAGITQRDHCPRQPRTLQRRVELIKRLLDHHVASKLVVLGDRLTQPPQRRGQQLGKLDLQRQIQTRQINQLGQQRRELALAQLARQPRDLTPPSARTPTPSSLPTARARRRSSA